MIKIKLDDMHNIIEAEYNRGLKAGYVEGYNDASGLCDFNEDYRIGPETERTCKFAWSLADNGWADSTCTECGYVVNHDIHVTVDYNYCPHCGAKVVGD